MEGEHYCGELVPFEVLGRFLKSMLKVIHVTVDCICQQSHMSKRTYYNILGGKEMRLNYYIRLLKVYLDELPEDDREVFLWKCYHYCQADIEAFRKV